MTRPGRIVPVHLDGRSPVKNSVEICRLTLAPDSVRICAGRGRVSPPKKKTPGLPDFGNPEEVRKLLPRS